MDDKKEEVDKLFREYKEKIEYWQRDLRDEFNNLERIIEEFKEKIDRINR